MNRAQEMGQRSIAYLLLKFSLPSIFSLVLHSLYIIVDRIFIGRGIGPLALAGVTIAFPVLHIVFALSIFCASGSSALISIYLGQKDKKRAEDIFGNTLVIITFLGFLTSFLGLMFKDRILDFFSVGPETFLYAREYLSIFISGAVFFFYGFTLTFIIRAEGNPIYATLMIVFGTLLNILLDYLFIFVFSMGISGAALATIISEAAVALMGIFYVMRKRGLLHIRRSHLRLNLVNFKKISVLGLSPALANIAGSIQIAFLNKRLILHGGEIAIAALGVVFSIGSIVRMLSFGIAAGIQPIVGYNYGAKLYKRVRDTFFYASLSGFLITLLIVLAIWFFVRPISGLFSKSDSELIGLSSHALRVFLVMSPFATIHILGTRFFQSIGKGGYAVFLGLLRQMVIFIPVLFVLSHLYSLEGVWLSGPATDIIALLITGTLIIREFRKIKYSVLSGI
ncbi:MAG: MATE family efflux transporter [Candidatus Kaelpia imicola]|nr:MATE family efflux transporter [Candidatus Kaelpia imicola]